MKKTAFPVIILIAFVAIVAHTNASSSSSRQKAAEAVAMKYKDGTYLGSSEQNIYGPVQVQALIKNGKISGITYVNMPDATAHTQQVTAMVKPILLKEAIKAQSASVDIVSGATQTSQSFQQSLQSALKKSMNS